MDKRRKFSRKHGQRKYKKLFIIAAEGSVTEPEYFRLFRSPHALVTVKCLRTRNQSAPTRVLGAIKKELSSTSLRSGDEAWVVVDRDTWEPDHLNELFAWSQTTEQYNMALTNPCFEFWLLLHFENGHGASTANDIKQRLRRHLPHYEKQIEPSRFNSSRINAAINLAETLDSPPSTTWPDEPRKTTVYRLVKKLMPDE